MAPGEEMPCVINDLERPVGTDRHRRRMYQAMLYWETAHPLRPPALRPGAHRDLAGSRQDRVLGNAGIGVERPHTTAWTPPTA
jgi:hypothetical protein